MTDARRAQTDRVQQELTTLSRRGNARSRRMREGLSETDHSVLVYLAEHPGCRGADLAEHFRMNRSTISRQVSALVDQGLIEISPAVGHSRSLDLSEQGRDLLARGSLELGAVLQARMARWSVAEIAAFAEALTRFNDEGRQNGATTQEDET
ncbi:MarR family transcriptional regulator [Rathayibacter sp. YIM 133350]|uniref:MarR family winged helix-turn-helix transcriptional regulator n=1 Tax=Rathayibacter sp. YIM 133350 TaxID=3131992 RepID=UPI00307F8BAA